MFYLVFAQFTAAASAGRAHTTKLPLLYHQVIKLTFAGKTESPSPRPCQGPLSSSIFAAILDLIRPPAVRTRPCEQSNKWQQSLSDISFICLLYVLNYACFKTAAKIKQHIFRVLLCCFWGFLDQ